MAFHKYEVEFSSISTMALCLCRTASMSPVVPAWLVVLTSSPLAKAFLTASMLPSIQSSGIGVVNILTFVVKDLRSTVNWL